VGGWTIVAVVLVGYALVARVFDRWSITAPIVLVACGTLLGSAFLDLLPANPKSESVRLLIELTLALILFADASTVDFGQAERDVGVPARLLGIGLPLTIGLGAVAAHLVLPSISWAEAGLIGAILAPTDAALGLAVVTNEAVPTRIRRDLNIESGLNDGIATPLVTVFLAMVVAGSASHRWATEALLELARGALVGVGVGLVGGSFLRWAKAAKWSTDLSDQLFVLGLAFIAYGSAVAISGNGFVAAFVAGLVFGAASRQQFLVATEFTDTVGLFSSFLVWIIFGAALVGPTLHAGIHLRPVLYALVSLTVVRMVPVALSLLGVRFRSDTNLFMGWFGPRGLASVVFTLIAFDALGGRGPAHRVVEVTTWTILLSVLLHGLSSGPLATAYGRRMSMAPGDTPELRSVAPSRVRRRGLL